MGTQKDRWYKSMFPIGAEVQYNEGAHWARAWVHNYWKDYDFNNPGEGIIVELETGGFDYLTDWSLDFMVRPLDKRPE